MAGLFKGEGAESSLPGEDAEKTILTWVDGEWHEGDIPLFTTMSPGAWLSSIVFDGARAFNGVAPDLDRHCKRAVASAKTMGLAPKLTAEEMEAIAWEGISKVPQDMVVYVRPTIWAGDGFVTPDPDSTKFAMVIFESPLPDPAQTFSACFSSFRRPTPESAPTEAKASCLYPNVARCMREAAEKGFDGAVVLDATGNVAEFATANLFLVKDGVVATPVINGSFLNGITRQRVIKLLQDDGYEVQERRVTPADVRDADELFSTGNYAKVQACTRIEERDLQPGPVFRRAYDLYFGWAAEQPSKREEAA